jgi:hypothetical protein
VRHANNQSLGKMSSYCAQIGRESHEHELLTANARPVAGAQCRSIGSGRISRTTGSEATGRAGQQSVLDNKGASPDRCELQTSTIGNPVPRASPSGRISLHLRSQALATLAIRAVQIDGVGRADRLFAEHITGLSGSLTSTGCPLPQSAYSTAPYRALSSCGRRRRAGPGRRRHRAGARRRGDR